MATITVDQLIGLLPNVDLHVKEGACDGVQNITTPTPFFVAPELAIKVPLRTGQTRAGDENFLAFLNSLAEKLKEPRQRPCVIVLGRPESIEMAALSFDDHTFAHLEIEFFEHEAANDLIAKQLDLLCDKDGLARLHRQHRKAFAKARDTFFERAVEVLGARARGGEISWNSPAVRSFLGYAPVLVAVAKYLATVDEARDYGGLEYNLPRLAIRSSSVRLKC